MATAIVPESPYHTQLEALDVGKKAAARHTEQLVANLSFLEGRNVEHITTSYPTSCSLVRDQHPNPNTYFTIYTFYYQKSPGNELVNLEIDSHPACTTNRGAPFHYSRYNLTCSIQLPTGASFLSGNNLHGARLEGRYIEEGFNDASQHGLIDVRSLDPNTVYQIHITASADTATSTQPNDEGVYIDGGLQRITVHEMPQFLMNVGTQAGFNSGSVDSVWATPYRRIVEGVRDDSGGITAGYGFVRMVDQTQQVLARWRNCWQVVNHEGSAAADGLDGVWRFPTNSSFAPLDFRIPGMTSTEQDFWIRTRNYYGSTTSQVNRYRLHVKHRGSAGFIDLNFESEPSATTGVSSVALPASATWITTTLDVNLPCDRWFIDQEQLVKFWFTGDAGSTEPVYIATLCLIENEPYPATTPV